ncbi:MAG: type II toxin-antitoxin system RelE/ParE family toxin [Isosphaeraceae bacterium]
MKPSVILRRIARAEFDEAADWYERRRAGQGLKFTAAVRQTLEDLSAWPEAHPVVHEDVREALVSRYPYAIYFRSTPGVITVLAVFHTSRDPVE